MKKKHKVLVLMGGRSAEHQISLQSAHNVISGLQSEFCSEHFEIYVAAIDKSGVWYWQNPKDCFVNTDQPNKIDFKNRSKTVCVEPGNQDGCFLVGNERIHVDVVFPVLHGTYGEDGTMQGFLEILNLPFVGSDTLGASMAMDKEVMKRLFVEANIPSAKYKAFFSKENALSSYQKVYDDLGEIVFVKPANTGSSVGVHKVRNQAQWQEAIQDAFLYDTKIIVEEFINGREIECAVLGNQDLKTSVPGEIICHDDFYSYDAKYLNNNASETLVPNDLSEKVIRSIQELSQKAVMILGAKGLARVDFFVTAKDQVYVNEINTMPGFTNISMYPKLWEHSGLRQPKLLKKLIELAFESFQKQNSRRV